MSQEGDKDFYLNLLREITKDQEGFVGKKVAVSKARSAPLEVDRNGEIQKYYGKGSDAIEILANQFQDVYGGKVAENKIKNTIDENVAIEDYEKLPQNLRPEKSVSTNYAGPGLIGRIKSILS